LWNNTLSSESFLGFGLKDPDGRRWIENGSLIVGKFVVGSSTKSESFGGLKWWVCNLDITKFRMAWLVEVVVVGSKGISADIFLGGLLYSTEPSKLLSLGLSGGIDFVSIGKLWVESVSALGEEAI